MEAGLMPQGAEAPEPRSEAPSDTRGAARASRARALSQGVVVWALAGLIFGGVGPGLVAMSAANPAEFAGFIVGSEAAGIVSGAIVGLLDWPRRLRLPTVWRVVLSSVIGLLLGPLWAGVAGAAGGVAFGASILAIEGGGSVIGSHGPSLDLLPTLGMMGAMFGVVVGTPAVVLFAMGRALTLSKGWPWWLPHAIAGGLIGLVGVWWMAPGPGFLGMGRVW